jgi:hypothetical protein
MVVCATGQADADQKAKESAWIARCQGAVQAKLKDPGSAQFKEVYFYRSKEGTVPVTCGKVNSKNSFGGYGGFQRFVSAGTPEMTFLEEEVTDFVPVWNTFCTGERVP